MRTRVFRVSVAAFSVTVSLCAAASAQSTPSASPPPAEVSASAAAEPHAFSAEIRIHRGMVDADAVPIRTVPDVRYRWERMRGDRGWRTVLTVLPIGAPEAAGAARPGPHRPVRIEIDEDGSPARLYDAAGRMLPAPSLAARRVLGNPVAGVLDAARVPRPFADRAARPPAPRPQDWADLLVAPSARLDARRERLASQFGAPVGRLGAFDRYLTTSGNRTIEALVDPDTAVPMEMNVTAGGALVSHTTFAYTSAADGSLVARGIHAEHRVSPRADRRTVLDIEFTGVSVSQGR